MNSIQSDKDAPISGSERETRVWNSTDLAGLLMEDQRERWSKGERLRPEDYLREHPQLAHDPEGLLDLIYNEVCLRTESNESPAEEEYAERFPQFAAELERLFAVHHAIDAADVHTQLAATVEWPGRRIAHYQIKERIGAGGMGQVFRARDLVLDREVALKLLPDHFTWAMKQRLVREAKESARLQHPLIATFYETGDADGHTYIAMEYVKGPTLRDVLRDGALPPRQAVAITNCILEALAHAHAWDILHRDIKPENVIVNGDTSAKLLDFGLAQRISGQSEKEFAGEMGARALVGTPGYMSPEQINDQVLDGRSDLFAVGAILYRC